MRSAALCSLGVLIALLAMGGGTPGVATGVAGGGPIAAAEVSEGESITAHGVSDHGSIAAPWVSRPDLAWQHWVLNCQGCHRTDGSGSPETAPRLAGTVAKFVSVPGGREYLVRVPGVATSPLANADLAELLNWLLWRFDAADLGATFKPYSAEEVATLRGRPLRTEAARLRARLVKQISAAGR